MTTNNHPAHGPVSLERLHQISEILSKAAVQSDGGNLGYAMADAVKVIDGAIAAFCAEPVKMFGIGSVFKPQIVSKEDVDCDNCAHYEPDICHGEGCPAALLHITKTEPVVVEYGDAYQGAREDLSIWKRRALEAEERARELEKINDYLVKESQGESRFGEPVIRESSPTASEELLSAMEEVLRISDRDHEAWHKVRSGIASCRAAMLQAGNSPVIPDEAYSDDCPDLYPSQPDAWAEGWNACRAAILQAGNSPVTPDGYVLVPKKLTAENGAKRVLSGEFSETKFINCPECFGDDDCETCDGSGRIEITVPVTWTTIKAIWAKGVEHFAAAPQQEVK